MAKPLLVAAAVLGATAVLTEAVGAHLVTPGHRGAVLFAAGVRYQLLHALAIMVAVLLAERSNRRWAFFPGCCLLLGTLCFSFGAFAPVLLDMRIHGAARTGLVLLVLGWTGLLVGACLDGKEAN
jgi:uncharacterized membrane protein YgdD (TMEM256/DUF423 family)